MAKKPPLAQADWDAIEAEYRAGQLSVTEIGRRFDVSHTAINKKAAAKGWMRDLAQRVRQAVAAKLISHDAAKPSPDPAKLVSYQVDETGGVSRVSGVEVSETVNRAADRGAGIVVSHRNEIGRLRRIGAIIADRLEAHLAGKEHEPGKPFIGPRESVGDLLEKLTRANTRMIQLERQAFSLNEPVGLVPVGTVDLRRFSDDALDKIEAALSEAADAGRDPSGESAPEG